MTKKYPNAVTFVAGCVVESDYVYVASFSDAYDPRENIFSRLFTYMGRFAGDEWYHHDVQSNIEAVCVKKATDKAERMLCALSKEGEVEIYSNKDGSLVWEKISEAGLRLGSRGYLTDIREIGTSLFACGANNQVYRRDDGAWTLLTAAPLEMVSALDPKYTILNSIDGNSEGDVYTCGMSGALFHFDGQVWKRIALKTTEHLNWVRCYGADEVWVCGHNGTLLRGSARHGFMDVSTIDDNYKFWSMAKFGDKVYLASDDGLLCYDGTRIAPVDTGLEYELETYKLDANTETLWSFGFKEVAYFDGSVWTRVDHPDNAPI